MGTGAQSHSGAGEEQGKTSWAVCSRVCSLGGSLLPFRTFCVWLRSLDGQVPPFSFDPCLKRFSGMKADRPRVIGDDRNSPGEQQHRPLYSRWALVLLSRVCGRQIKGARWKACLVGKFTTVSRLCPAGIWGTREFGDHPRFGKENGHLRRTA